MSDVERVVNSARQRPQRRQKKIEQRQAGGNALVIRKHRAARPRKTTALHVATADERKHVERVEFFLKKKKFNINRNVAQRTVREHTVQKNVGSVIQPAQQGRAAQRHSIAKRRNRAVVRIAPIPEICGCPKTSNEWKQTRKTNEQRDSAC